MPHATQDALAATLEDMIWRRQYAQVEGEDFARGARRVATSIAGNEGDAAEYEALITSRRFVPGGRILAGAGSEHGNLLNCFVQDGAPFDSGRTPGVMLLARKLALVTKVGGGNGLNLDPIPAARAYRGPLGKAWLTIRGDHPDFAHVRDGTFMDLARGVYLSVPYRQLRFAEHPPVPATARTVHVEDSVDGIWTAAADMVATLLRGEDVVVDLSGLRPEGAPVKGSGGASSGPGSFAAEVFENFARWAALGGAEHAGPVATLRYVYAPTLRVIRQAGVRRGAGMATLSATHPDLRDFVTAKDLEREAAEGDISTFNISVLAGDDFMRRATSGDDPSARAILDEIAEHAWSTGEPGLIFIDAINAHNPLLEADGPITATNPCVTADTWVMTGEGARQVRDLVGVGFRAVFDGREYATGSRGFWSTGVKPVLRITTASGFELRLTGNHRLKRVTRQTRYLQESEWAPADALLPGDSIVLQDHRDITPWGGAGTFVEGWLLGSLVGDGTFRRDRATPLALLDYWGEESQQVFGKAVAAIGVLDRPEDTSWHIRSEAAGRIRIASTAATRLAAEYGITAGNKTVTDEVERGSFEFCRGFLRGLFDADGSVQGSQEKGVSVRLAQSDLALLQRVQRMLARLGVISTIYAERRQAGFTSLPDGRGGRREYPVRAQHELAISRDNLGRYAELIGFENPAKAARLAELLSRYSRTPNRERFSDEIVAIDPDGEEEVFDVTVQDVHAFDANGMTAHNCGEIPLYPGEPCDLGAINLAAHIVDGKIDRTRLEATARKAVRFLDDVLTAEKSPLPEIHEAIADKRRIGLGVMGLADMLIRLGRHYGTETGRAAVRKAIGVMRDAALSESSQLALERGIPSGVGRAGLQRRNIAIFTVAPTGTTSMLAGVSGGVEPVFAATYTRRIGTEYVKVVHPLLEEILADIPAAGRFATEDETWDHEALVAALDGHHGSLLPLLPDLPADPRLEAFVTAHDVSPRDHVLMQAAVQRAFDWTSDEAWQSRDPEGRTLAGNSISKTCNLPNGAAVEDVLQAYELAWNEGCKGITVYRDGSRDLQVLTTSGTGTAEQGEAAAGQDSDTAAQDGPAAGGPDSSGDVRMDVARVAEPEPAEASPPQAAEPRFAAAGDARLEYAREQRMHGVTDKVRLADTNGVTRGFFITVNSDAAGDPREVFIISGKAGDEANGDSEALGRVVSIALQYGVPPEAVVSTLRGISGGMFGTYQGRIVTSKADLIAVALETAHRGGVGTAGPVAGNSVGSAVGSDPHGAAACPHCGAEMRHAEGCLTCTNAACGWSKCA